MMKIPNYHRSTQVHHTPNLHNNLIPAQVINGMLSKGIQLPSRRTWSRDWLAVTAAQAHTVGLQTRASANIPPTWGHSSQPDLITASTPLSARRSSTSNLHDILYHHSLTDNFLSGPTALFSTPSRSHDVTTIDARRVTIYGAFEPSGQHLGTASQTLQKAEPMPPPRRLRKHSPP
ncbi:hypothetical protein NEUTE1DRAFT_127442 [Neurospora tetrasperma FGSC 2508]|uniref:Uncharacterized protein n=1 Tax=Neurospora tetrasperma (strain FGSC 2508 / ATCC MYA-4615 / P0657) TaxID=510951 RepID=F8MDA4_NEUT8|nr:uncharacterized protein NEUTE1DRAFT_127442 [Neurospora tetrasperma FGSC 2508]EGO60596.1 hypothetical protein NEUTE1DRAFT_127442 [Neurospora tetrasperma FGSC 2508]EGZ75424.1 hypothetical protein NEUTE2DRAFT_148557 [Neurospora tetrasperma FGSC 2509]